MRTLVIGDIHGAYKALIDALERANVTDSDTLIFLGDYVDGWSEAYEVINFLMALEQQQSCIFIKGNHDMWLEAWLRDGAAEDVWLFNGGEATVDSYKRYHKENYLKHLHFIQRMRDYHVDENKNLFIHAGFTSLQGPQAEKYASNYSWDRTLWEMVCALDPTLEKDSVFYPRRLKRFTEIFIGHTPTIHYGSATPMHKANLWNVDTGAAFDGKITVMDIATKAFWQSEGVRTYYPNEVGRNKD